MSDAIKTFEAHGYTVSIYTDEHPEDPLEDDPAGIKIAYLKTSRYVLGNNPVSYDEMSEIKNGIGRQYMGLPVWAYVHSGVTLKAAASRPDYPFNCPWGSAQSGFVYMDRNTARKEIGDGDYDKALVEAVELFNKYLNNEFVGFVITDKDGGVVESCWGFDDVAYCEEQARAAAKAAQPQLELELN